MTPIGFPHSDIRGSKHASCSPRRFAGCCVLLRLSVPRHPPCALNNLPVFVFLQVDLSFTLLSSYSFRAFDAAMTKVSLSRRHVLAHTVFTFSFFFSYGKIVYRLSFQRTSISTVCLVFNVGRSGLEPPASRLSGVCSNQLSYRPVGALASKKNNRCS
jgi:hypothetical protein